MGYEIDNKDSDPHKIEPTYGDEPDYTLPSVKDLVDEVNIAELLPEQTLIRIGDKIVEGYEEDETSRTNWLKKYKEGMEVALQVAKDRTYPWPKASNVKFPLMTIACLQFHARAYPVLVPESGPVAVKAVGKDPSGMKGMRADRVQTHMNFQIMEQMDTWDEEMDRLLITLPITGTEFKKRYYDSELKRNVSEHVFSKDLVVNYFAKTLESAIRKTHIMEMSRNEFEEKVRAGLYLDIDNHIVDVSPRDDDTTRVIKEGKGLEEPKQDEDTPLNILECHTFCDLDKDGYAEPYIITVNKDTKKVARIVARYQKSNVTIKNQQIIRIIPDEYFIKYTFIPSPDGGFYGLGFIHIVGAINKATDTIINQLIDAGTLSNLQSGFLSRNFRQRGGNMQFVPGEWKVVNSTGQDLANGIYPLPVREPSNVLFQLLGMLIEVGQRITNTTDIMVGENPGQNQKATTTMAVVEAGQKVFTAVYKRVRRALGKEILSLYKLNTLHFNREEYADVIDVAIDTPDLEKDYTEGDIKIFPSADPNASSSAQKLAKAQALVQLIPLGISRMVVLKRLLNALEIENIEEFQLEQAEQAASQPPPEVQLKAQELELKGQEFQLKAMKQEQDMGLDEREQTRKEAETRIKAETAGVTSDIKSRDSDNKLTIAAMNAAVTAAKGANSGE